MPRCERQPVSYRNAGVRLAMISHTPDEREKGRELIRKGLQLAEEQGDALSAARCESELGYEEMRFGEYAKARPHFENALPTLRQKGTPTELGWCLMELALAISALGEEDQAIQLEREAYSVARNSDDEYLRGSCAKAMACMHTYSKKPEFAKPYWIEAIDCFQKLSSPFPEAELRLKMAKIALKTREPQEAIRLCDIARTRILESQERYASILQSRIESVVAQSYEQLGSIELAEQHRLLSTNLDIGM